MTTFTLRTSDGLSTPVDTTLGRLIEFLTAGRASVAIYCGSLLIAVVTEGLVSWMVG